MIKISTRIMMATGILSCSLVVVANAAKICTRPQFAQELEYRAILFGGKVSPQEAIKVGKEYDDILTRYCREVKSLPKAEKSEHVGDNCFQMTGTYHGKTVYWGQCYE